MMILVDKTETSLDGSCCAVELDMLKTVFSLVAVLRVNKTCCTYCTHL